MDKRSVGSLYDHQTGFRSCGLTQESNPTHSTFFPDRRFRIHCRVPLPEAFSASPLKRDVCCEEQTTLHSSAVSFDDNHRKIDQSWWQMGGYDTFCKVSWWGKTDSNRQPMSFGTPALDPFRSLGVLPRSAKTRCRSWVPGFSDRCSYQLSYSGVGNGSTPVANLGPLRGSRA